MADARKPPLALAALTQCPACGAARRKLEFAGAAFAIAAFNCAAEIMGSDATPRLTAIAGCRTALADLLASPFVLAQQGGERAQPGRLQ